MRFTIAIKHGLDGYAVSIPNYYGGVVVSADEHDAVVAQRDRYRAALETLMQFGESLMASKIEDERGIGVCIAEGARVVRESPNPENRKETQDG